MAISTALAESPMGRRRKTTERIIWDEQAYRRLLEDWLRRKPGARIEDFCSEAGCSVSTARRLGESGQDPGIYLVSSVADVFGVEVEELLRKPRGSH